MRDFTPKLYQDLLEVLIEKGYSLVPDPDHGKDLQKRVILRHDIDAMPLRALSMAHTENRASVRSTYFFKVLKKIFQPDLVRKIASLDHQIGYHYEDLVRNHGNYEKAISDFERNLDTIRKVFPVEIICADGEPLSRYNNLWLWEKYDYRKFGIKCEIYLDIDYNNIAYFTDTGRSWHGMKYNVWDHVQSSRTWPHYQTTMEMISAVRDGTFPEKALINIHPQRWNDDLFPWTRELVLQNSKNILKLGFIWAIRDQVSKGH